MCTWFEVFNMNFVQVTHELFFHVNKKLYHVFKIIMYTWWVIMFSKGIFFWWVHSDSTNRSYLNPFLHKSQKRVIFPACHFDHVLFVRVHHPGLPSIYTCVHMYKYSFYICMQKYMIRDMHDDQTVDIQHTQQQQLGIPSHVLAPIIPCPDSDRCDTLGVHVDPQRRWDPAISRYCPTLGWLHLVKRGDNTVKIWNVC